jgi:hypothetical protein
MSNDEEARDVRKRMAELRREVGGDVKQLSDSARVMTDWRYYVKRFPWATMALAAAGGYLIVPQRTRIISPDADTLAQLAKQNKLVVTQEPKSQSSDSLLQRLVSLAAMGAARAGIAYFAQALSARSANGAKSGQPSRREQASIVAD